MDDLNGTAAEQQAWADMQAAIERCRLDPTVENRELVERARQRLEREMIAASAPATIAA